MEDYGWLSFWVLRCLLKYLNGCSWRKWRLFLMIELILLRDLWDWIMWLRMVWVFKLMCILFVLESEWVFCGWRVLIWRMLWMMKVVCGWIVICVLRVILIFMFLVMFVILRYRLNKKGKFFIFLVYLSGKKEIYVVVFCVCNWCWVKYFVLFFYFWGYEFYLLRIWIWIMLVRI